MIRINRNYRLLVILFPLVYIAHNLEEGIVFSSKYQLIQTKIPDFIKSIFALGDATKSFWIALIFASILPIVFSVYLYQSESQTRIKVLLFITVLTTVNIISHITSSIFLGFASPGLITAILICIPYTILVYLYCYKHHGIRAKHYIPIIILSIPIFILIIALSWLFGIAIA